MNLEILKNDVLVSCSFSSFLCLVPSLLQHLEKKFYVEVFSIIKRFYNSSASNVNIVCFVKKKKSFTIVMSFGLASETVETQLLFQIFGLGAVWKQLCVQLLDGNVRLKNT